MALPPLEAGSTQLTAALASPAVADTPVGAPGTPWARLVSVYVATGRASAGALAVTVKAPTMPLAVSGVAVATPVGPVVAVVVAVPLANVAEAPVMPGTAVNTTWTPPSRTGVVPFLRLAPRWIGKAVLIGTLCLSPPEVFRMVAAPIV